MKIIITGVAGFVARHFLNFLNEQPGDFDVLGYYHYSLPDFSENDFTHINLHLKQIDMLDKNSFEKSMIDFQPTHILHLAALSSIAESWKKPDEFILFNSTMILNIVEVMRKYQLKTRLLSVGSAEEYGIVEHLNPNGISENIPSNPVSPYGIARVLQRRIAELYSVNFGLDIVHSRSFNHFGTYQKENFVIPSFAKQIITQKLAGNKKVSLVVGDVSVQRDFTDVRDIANAYFLLLLKGENGEVYNVCSGNSFSLKDILNLLAEKAEVEITYTEHSDKMRPNENKVLKGNPSKLKQSTGWKPTHSIENSLLELLNYWREKLLS